MAATHGLWTLLTAAALLALHASIVDGSILVDQVRMTALADTASGDSNTANTTSAPTVPPGSTQLCDPQLLFQKLYVLMPAINQCAMESDYFIKPSNLSMPSEASLAKYCESKNCSLLSLELDNAGLPSCSVAVGDTTMAFKVFFKNIKEHCDTSSVANSSAPSAPSTGNDANSYKVSMLAWQLALGVAVISLLAAV